MLDVSRRNAYPFRLGDAEALWFAFRQEWGFVLERDDHHSWCPDTIGYEACPTIHI